MKSDNPLGFYIVDIEDQIVQITSYIVRAENEDKAKEYVTKGIYMFESEREIVDTVESGIKKVEKVS